ncbi:hypothetical protein DFH08DRAFT_954101 [Mycena albidolilacea]|uniref:Uncharacterized protein n=1 Tax=Mycena albidolilacea TaxID=1033008 RepID=A0AAD7AER2_9AGAR|nr:hypothetical protein DFH08DRAFT_954101 [Mycena albidolilacea]
MPPQDPPFPSRSLILSQHAQFTPVSYIVFPWTSVSYQVPIASAPIKRYPILVAQPPAIAPTQNTLSIVIKALRKLFALVTGLRARATF